MTLTLKAIQYIQTINTQNQVLRVKVLAGGCSGLSYKMEFVDNYEPTDKLVDLDVLMCVVDPKSWLFIKDLEIDYEDGLNGQGMVYRNVQAKRVCGCGSSFSV